MPAGKLCRGGSINPEIKGCVYTWTNLILTNPIFCIGCIWFKNDSTSRNLHWLQSVQTNWYCWAYDTMVHYACQFQHFKMIYIKLWFLKVKPLLNHIHCKAFKSSPTFILTNWTPYNSLQPRHQSKDLDHTRVCWETTPVASELSCAHWAKRSLRTVACPRISEGKWICKDGCHQTIEIAENVEFLVVRVWEIREFWWNHRR